MQYRQLVKDGSELSILGYGCMRFPTKRGSIDEEKAISQMLYAYENGVNYYDTAYPYHGGKSEVMLGKFIKEYDIRDKIYIADKLPVFLVRKAEQFETYFQTQLERLDTGYIDYYLMHMLDTYENWCKLKEMGILNFIEEKKSSGKIKHIGFSFHGPAPDFIKILEDYDWEFCQIQYNYLDENTQAGRRGLVRADELGIGVVIMEPLRGGNLAAKAPEKVKDLFADFEIKRSPAQWSLRWLFNHPEVSVVLSGMNVDEHIKENIAVASETAVNSMTEKEVKVVKRAKDIYDQLMKVPCTGCNYCMPCPFGVDIPGIFGNYNDKYYFEDRSGMLGYLAKQSGMMGGKTSATICTDCGVCMKHCPQEIQIPDRLKEAHNVLHKPVLQFAANTAAKFMGSNRRKDEK